jgi:hypothetical protein
MLQLISKLKSKVQILGTNNYQPITYTSTPQTYISSTPVPKQYSPVLCQPPQPLYPLAAPQSVLHIPVGAPPPTWFPSP